MIAILARQGLVLSPQHMLVPAMGSSCTGWECLSCTLLFIADTMPGAHEAASRPWMSVMRKPVSSCKQKHSAGEPRDALCKHCKQKGAYKHNGSSDVYLSMSIETSGVFPASLFEDQYLAVEKLLL